MHRQIQNWNSFATILNQPEQMVQKF
jgi:hypothetical protein